MLPLSATTQAALLSQSSSVSAYIHQNADVSLSAVAGTLQTARRSLSVRRALVVDQLGAALSLCDNTDADTSCVVSDSVPDSPVSIRSATASAVGLCFAPSGSCDSSATLTAVPELRQALRGGVAFDTSMSACSGLLPTGAVACLRLAAAILTNLRAL